jgi:hypothetical protein
MDTEDFGPIPPDGGNLPRYYVNWIRPDGNLYDLALELGYQRRLSDPPDPDTDVEWQAEVVMSWEEAAILADMLTSQIENYEAQVAPIRRWGDSPPDLDAESNGNPKTQG